MSKTVVVDLFAEDRAHEEWLKPLLERIAREENTALRIRVRSARGGHARAIDELKTYQRAFEKGIGGALPDLVVAAIDANCSSFAEAQKTVQSALEVPFQACTVKATPAPHIERWFLADRQAFQQVVGIVPKFQEAKCERDYYKKVLAKAVDDAGHPPTLGGIEFAREIVDALDYYRAGNADTSFKHFLEEIRGAFKRVKE